MPIYHTAALDGDHRLASARKRWASLPLCPSYGRRIATSPGLQAVGTNLELLEAVTQA
jgi:hypothetical protein